MNRDTSSLNASVEAVDSTGQHQQADDAGAALDVQINSSSWHNLYTSNNQQEDTSSSRRDNEWGFAYESSNKTKRKKRWKVGSCSSAVNSSSDVSEALSDISAQLSLSSSDSSGERDHLQDERQQVNKLSEIDDVFKFLDDEMKYSEWFKDAVESLKQEIGISQAPTAQNQLAVMDDSTSFGIHSLSSDSDTDDLLSRDSDGDGVQAQLTSDGSSKKLKDNIQGPELGMVFSSQEEAYRYYRNYAEQTGFKVRKGKVQRLSNGSIRKQYFFCSRQGFRSKKQSDKTTKYKRKETRTGCNAKIQCTVENGKWAISQFCQEHNHDFEGPRCMTMTGTNAETSEAQEVQDLICYLRHLQEDDPSFLHAFQHVNNSRVANFFWSDGRSKIDYEHFGDVLILDTKFKMENFGMTCALFLGLNHHRQYILFGCALLLDECRDSLVWLFETFMEVMGRHQPRTIITDESEAMVDTIKVVFPEAKHQFGLWYIHQNATVHLSTYYDQPGFKNLFNECISGCLTEEELASKWKSLLQQFNLGQIPWLNALYRSRERWAQLFNKTNFCAGIEVDANFSSIFHNIKSNPKNLSMFVGQYLKAVKQQRKQELHEDSHCKEKASLMTGCLMEKQAANTYTYAMFKMFQEELLKCLSLAVVNIYVHGTIAIFKLVDDGHKERIVEKSTYDSSFACCCKKCESIGILCSHALKVYNVLNIFDLPQQYILKRWTKSAKDGVLADEEMPYNSQYQVSSLMQKALNVISKSVAVEKSQQMAENHLDMALKSIEDVIKTENRGTSNPLPNTITSDMHKDFQVKEALRVQSELLRELHQKVQGHREMIEASRIALKRSTATIFVAYLKRSECSSADGT